MTEQDYKQEIDFIFNQFPSYQKVGKIAYKPGIETMLQMDDILGNPHKKFKSIHIAGTNGKGSTSHMIASALMRVQMNNATAGSNSLLRIGLYTSPHLVDFRERIKVNGEMVTKQFVYDFIIKYKEIFLKYKASFFEITTAMAFAWFAEQKVDIAVIECGLGGRLDSTNIITPLLSIITNIGLDHCEYLGYTYGEIAKEKAGIIKRGIPVIIGERGNLDCDCNVEQIFIDKALEVGAPIYFAEDINKTNELFRVVNMDKMDLQGDCQDKNIRTVCLALSKFYPPIWENNVICANIIANMVRGIENAAHDTGLRGRWEKLNNSPLIICDTGHNAHGFKILGKQIENEAKKRGKLFMVFGVVADKDLDSIVQFLPNYYNNANGNTMRAYYYFVNAAGSRALPSKILEQKMLEYGFNGEAVECENTNTLEGTVNQGLHRAMEAALPNDFIFIGGSTFVVAEAFYF
ncbi:MAG: Mur ligase family protein [Bacteroidales bacterium]